MGVYQFRLPDVGEGTAEAEIVAWHVKVGDVVHEDQNLVDVMTDKATVEMPVPIGGKVLALHGEPGDMAAVGAVLVEIEVEGEGNARAAKPAAAAPVAVKASEPKPAPVAAPAATTAPKPVAAPQPVAVQRTMTGGKPLASPAVRARADELGIKLQYVPGTGPAGRITHSDLDTYAQSGGRASAHSAYVARDGVDEVKVIGLRRRIAEKMLESKRRIPHYAYIDEVDMTELESLRAYLNSTKKAEQPKLNVLPFLMRALVKVLPEFPQINARFDDDAGVVHRYRAVHIGIATQTDNGLIVPVAKHAEARDIWDCAHEVARVATAARENKAAKDELSGSTITVTSLGALGGIATTPVINYPEVAIIGPNAIIDRPVVRDGQIVVRKMMNLSSSFDHRVVDGFDAAQFIKRIKGLLEHPAAIFVD